MCGEFMRSGDDVATVSSSSTSGAMGAVPSGVPSGAAVSGALDDEHQEVQKLSARVASREQYPDRSAGFSES